MDNRLTDNRLTDNRLTGHQGRSDGSDAPAFSQATALSYLDHIARHGVRLAEIPQCGHFPMYANPVAMWRAIADFYTDVAAD
ncbi:alpha/beta fold hydrolase [Dickeya sp. Secpp 1600]|uniref:alpha/beta fold hydrolase n=1 Tax=Dickeya sp. Secpp 1600 TaxID=2037915 RepID=UPI001C9E598F|nr:alpha/beta hydrolase [Dickeya sp. Secpp 1600]